MVELPGSLKGDNDNEGNSCERFFEDDLHSHRYEREEEEMSREKMAVPTEATEEICGEEKQEKHHKHSAGSFETMAKMPETNTSEDGEDREGEERKAEESCGM